MNVPEDLNDDECQRLTAILLERTADRLQVPGERLNLRIDENPHLANGLIRLGYVLALKRVHDAQAAEARNG